ncbi:Zinc finger protein [Wickerhamomyces ciferrii]|uniref:Zinc finger protein n=1 Tax=Wickerhamomyces ciferrii (strain ATCC 14091 / BCRC 22168 / CBS 111 / JCM 3599 / NBRC 0793 / NRRL Y-1031 F-60-10) TaxID=1206466 RepID=K0KDN5_WICCF|nr:Zinc finger protein [Wickerhamomyces ciferrii]CCH41036.1 Zinc finger protein [Wickerhamomyces ciferrii]
MNPKEDENDSDLEYDHIDQHGVCYKNQLLIETILTISIEVNNLISSILNKIKMSSNHITSINNLINNEEDEDRKFLRAAAEAIVATSMDNQIDPTILELLRRIQYANVPGSINPNTGTSAYHTSTSTTPLSSNNLNNTVSNPLTNNQLNLNQSPTNSTGNSNSNSNILNYLDTSSNINPAKNIHHFPTFNLNYFDSLQQSQSQTTTTSNDFDHNSNTNSSWSINNGHNQGQPLSTPTPNSQNSTPPSTSSRSQGGINDPKPFLCSDCNLSFRRSSDLRRHQRAHLPILPHICKKCGKGFARKDALKRHSDTLTCKRNREKLLNSGGDVESILNEAKKQGHDI